MRSRLLLAALLMAALSCGDKPADSDADMAKLLVKRGKRELGESQFTAASKSFSTAGRFDAQNKEARFGRALSEILITYEQLSLVVRAAGFGDLVPNAAQPDRPGDGTADEADMYNRIVLQILLPMRDQLAAAANALDGVVGSDFEFRIATLPVKWNADTILELGGTWRAADVRLVGGLAHGVAGVLELLFAHELRVDLFDTLDYFSAYTGSFESLNLTGPQLLNVVVHVFTQNPDFLGMLARDADGDGEIDGVALPARASRHLATMASDLAAMRVLAEKNAGLLRPEEGKGEVLTELVLDGVLVIGKQEDGSLEYGNISIPVTELFESGLLNLEANLEGSGTPLSWADDVLPAVAVPAVALVRIITQLDFELSSTVRNVLRLINSPGAVETVVLSYVPDVIAFDPAAWFAAPTGLRTMLPRWREDGIAESERNFFFEWECNPSGAPFAEPGTTGAFLRYKAADEDEEDYHFTCPEDAATDGPHFPASATAAAVYAAADIKAIAADGLAGRLPYIVFGDPSFGGVLLLEADESIAAGENPVGEGSLKPAGLRGLNAFINQVYEDLPL